MSLAYALVLIVLASGSAGIPAVSTTILYGFNTLESCNKAKEQIKKDTNWNYQVAVSCIPVDYRP